MSMVAPLWKPKRLKRSNDADSAMTETLKTPVRAIMPQVWFALLTATHTRSGSFVTCWNVLTMQPLSLSPSRAVST